MTRDRADSAVSEIDDSLLGSSSEESKVDQCKYKYRCKCKCKCKYPHASTCNIPEVEDGEAPQVLTTTRETNHIELGLALALNLELETTQDMSTSTRTDEAALLVADDLKDHVKNVNANSNVPASSMSLEERLSAREKTASPTYFDMDPIPDPQPVPDPGLLDNCDCDSTSKLNESPLPPTNALLETDNTISQEAQVQPHSDSPSTPTAEEFAPAMIHISEPSSSCGSFHPTIERSQSFINSLPVAETMPETQPISSSITVVAVASDVVRISSTSESTIRASMIGVKVFKKSKDTKLGIRFQASTDGMLQIGKLTGMLASSPLRTGDQVLRMDGQNVAGWVPTRAINYLRDCKGWISIVARTLSGDATLAHAAVLKSRPQDKLGISFVPDDVTGKLCIRNLNVAGLLGNRSVVKVGDVVESINGIPCSEVANGTAVSIIRGAPEWVTVLVNKTDSVHHKPSTDVVRDITVLTSDSEDELERFHHPPHYPPHPHDDLPVATAAENSQSLPLSEDPDEHIEPTFISVMAHKATPETKLGISLVKFDGVVYIARLTEGGLLATSSPLKEGMQLMSVDSHRAQGWTVNEALTYLRHAVGSIHILAHNPHGHARYVQAMVYKSKSDNAVGVSFKGSAGRQLKVCTVRADGLFAHSALNVGDSVVSINNIPCRHNLPREAVEIVRGSMEQVTILAKKKSSSGVVVARAC
jgi:C-terminal processing protease CtpA/Prc